MQKSALIAAASLLILSAAPAHAQDDLIDAKIQVVHVAGNIYMLNGEGGNIGVSVGEDGILMVDDKFASLADTLRSILAKLGGGRLRFILNTHFHGDHVGGNPIFASEVPIIAHTRVRQRLQTRPRLDQRYFPAVPRQGWPVVTFEDSLSIHFNGEEIKAIHFPRSHTDGDIAIFFTGSNVVHLGDLFFNRRFPFVDLDYGGDVEGLTQNIAEILRDLPPDARIIPGHGPLGDRDDLETYHRLLVETADQVRQSMASGMSLDQIKAKGLPEEWQEWNWVYIPARRWIEIVYWSLARAAQ